MSLMFDRLFDFLTGIESHQLHRARLNAHYARTQYRRGRK